jgi:hypothetical protein
MVRLLVVLGVFLGWQAFADGPLAYYVLSNILITGLAIEGAINKKPNKEWAVYALCAFGGFTTSLCGALFSVDTDNKCFLCDRGSGLPVSLLFCLAALAVAGYLVGTKRNG